VSRSPDEPIRAAGCVVWRHGDDGVEVVLVHRPAPHDDWSLPKGKLDPGERHSHAALREVHEETGLRGELGPKLTEVTYELPTGHRKVVRWWALEALLDDGFEANDEIDDRRWVPVDDAAEALDWDTDRTVLQAFVETVLVHLPDTFEG
jgi:8-oxo-dGTP diphosphatase